jgi:cytosine/adenosine deaminase-related metal-dependent hydrolase
MTRFSLTARWVLPIDGDPLEGALVTIDDGVVVAVAERSAATGPVHDLGDAVLLPGLINAHTHLEFSHLPQPLGTPGMKLPDWIRLVISDRRRRDSRASIAAGLRESRECGVTALGDIATSPPLDLPHPHPQLLAFQEVIGFSAARRESSFADLQQRLDNNRDSTKHRPGISPHAPYTVHPQLLERLVDEAQSRELPVAMHLAESPEELELLAAGTGPFRELLAERSMWDTAAIPRGSTPMDYLRVLARAPQALVVHGNYLATSEIEFLGRRRGQMSVVYCPRTHEFFQHNDYPLREMLAAGVRVALGTDSRASNPD